MSLRPRHGYAADLPHGLRERQGQTTREVPRHHHRGSGCAPLPAQIRQIRAGEGLRDVRRRFLAYSSPSRSPGLHHLTVLAHPGLVGAAPTLPGTTRIRLPPAPRTCCDRPEAKVSHLHSNHSASRRKRKLGQNHFEPSHPSLEKGSAGSNSSRPTGAVSDCQSQQSGVLSEALDALMQAQPRQIHPPPEARRLRW